MTDSQSLHFKGHQHFRGHWNFCKLKKREKEGYLEKVVEITLKRENIGKSSKHCITRLGQGFHFLGCLATQFQDVVNWAVNYKHWLFGRSQPPAIHMISSQRLYLRRNSPFAGVKWNPWSGGIFRWIINAGVPADPPPRFGPTGHIHLPLILPLRILPPPHFRFTVRVEVKMRVRVRVIAFVPSILETFAPSIIGAFVPSIIGAFVPIVAFVPG